MCKTTDRGIVGSVLSILELLNYRINSSGLNENVYDNYKRCYVTQTLKKVRYVKNCTIIYPFGFKIF